MLCIIPNACDGIIILIFIIIITKNEILVVNSEYKKQKGVISVVFISDIDN